MSAPYGTIACFVDRSDVARQVIDEAAALRALSPGRLVLVTITPSWQAYATEFGSVWVPDEEALAASTRTWLDERLSLAAAHGVTAEAVVLEGYPAAYVACRWAEEQGADLLVAGAHRGIMERVFLGSFAGYLTHHAPCPVLLVRPIVLASADVAAEPDAPA